MSQKLKVYQYPKCSTCVNALKFLAKHKLTYENIDISAQPPTPSEVKKMIKYYNGDLRKVFNTSGIQYRELQLKDKLPTMSEEEAVQLLSSNGKLVKRPFVLGGDVHLVGFKEEEWKKQLL